MHSRPCRGRGDVMLVLPCCPRCVQWLSLSQARTVFSFLVLCFFSIFFASLSSTLSSSLCLYLLYIFIFVFLFASLSLFSPLRLYLVHLHLLLVSDFVTDFRELEEITRTFFHKKRKRKRCLCIRSAFVGLFLFTCLVLLFFCLFLRFLAYFHVAFVRVCVYVTTC